MRHSFAIVAFTLLCTACSGNETPKRDHRWFNTYQTDTSCQVIHPHKEDPFEKGPTGRAHPF